MPETWGDRPHRALLTLLIPGEPCPKGRPRAGRGRIYTPAATRFAEASIAWQARLAMPRPMDDSLGRFLLWLRFHCARSWGSDTDNLAKLVMDALSPRARRQAPRSPVFPLPGLIWRNDRQVVAIDAQRYDGSEQPRTEIAVARAELSCHG